MPRIMDNRGMSKKALLAAALLALLPAAEAAELTRLVPGQSRITFTSQQMGVPVDGQFKRFAAQVAVDPARPEAGRARIEVDLASIDTGLAEADSEAQGKSWFNTAAFPKATFVSERVQRLGPGRYQAVGKLSIKGVSRDIVAPFTVRPAGNGAWFDGGFTLKRLQFRIGEGDWADTGTVADDVQVRFKLYLVP